MFGIRKRWKSMDSKQKSIAGFVMALTLLTTSAFALWLVGFNIQGYITGTSGSQETQYESWNITIDSDDTREQSFIYTNPDGVKDVNFTLTDNLVSTDANCEYESGKDIRFYIDGVEITVDSPVEKTLNEGDNNYTIAVEPHTNRCPVYGDYLIGFDI